MQPTHRGETVLGGWRLPMNALSLSLFAVPFIAGLLIAGSISHLGIFLRLRDEWLAALAIAHLSAAGTLIAAAADASSGVGAALGAFSGLVLKQLGARHGNTIYVLMYLLGWSVLMLAAANTSLGHSLGRAVLDGQLYFASAGHAIGAALIVVILLITTRWFSARLLRARLMPEYEHVNALPAWRWHLAFDATVALAIALAISALGVVGAFALAFIPAWIAFVLAASWRSCQWIGLGLGLCSYLAAFAVALRFDQPFGPTLVVMLIAGAAGTLAYRRVASPPGADA